jgi:hypothetical protein
LVEIKAHGDSGRARGGEFRVKHGMPGVIEGGLNIRALQFRVASQNGVPRLALGQLLQDDGHGNPGAFDNRLTSADTRVDFNSVAHDRKLALCHSRVQPFRVQPLIDLPELIARRFDSGGATKPAKG